MPSPSLAEVRATGQPPEIFLRLNDEHWAGRAYMRRVSPGATWIFARLGWPPNAVTTGFIVCGLAAGAVVALGGLASAIAAAVLVQAYLLLDCADGELARWSGRTSAAGVYLDGIGHYLGVAIGSLVNIFGLERMAIGGGFGVAAFEQLLPAARGAVLREVLGDGGRALQIERAVLGEAAGMIGAGLIALEALQCRPR